MPPKNAHIKPVIGTTPTDFGSQEVHFDRKEFLDFIDNHGYECTIERALRCPCLMEGGGSALADCANCGGTGWFFIDKTHSRVACVSMSNVSKYVPWSEQNAGTVSISYRPIDKLGFMDRIALLELESWFSETKAVKRNKSNTNLFFFTTYTPIKVFYVYLFDTKNNPLISVDSSKFTISGNKVLLDFSTFDTMQTERDSISATLLYTHNPTYHAIDINRDLMKQYDNIDVVRKNLPLHCTARKTHFVLDEQKFNNESLFDNTNYNLLPVNPDAP